MREPKIFLCTICGEPRSGNERWFLIVEDRWQDKLKILHWDDRLAAFSGIHYACGPGHLQQLVVHWMTTARLDHPFAQTAINLPERAQRRTAHPPIEVLASSGLRQIGELAVHRESMQRVLKEHPRSLQTILDALLSALHRDSPRAEAEMQWRDLALLGALPEV